MRFGGLTGKGFNVELSFENLGRELKILDRRGRGEDPQSAQRRAFKRKGRDGR